MGKTRLLWSWLSAPAEPIVIQDDQEWRREHDELSKSIGRVITLAGTLALFCLLTLGASDTNLVGEGAQVGVARSWSQCLRLGWHRASRQARACLVDAAPVGRGHFPATRTEPARRGSEAARPHTPELAWRRSAAGKSQRSGSRLRETARFADQELPGSGHESGARDTSRPALRSRHVVERRLGSTAHPPRRAALSRQRQPCASTVRGSPTTAPTRFLGSAPTPTVSSGRLRA